ncbi:glutathione S-transferase family protein [Lysobacter olei]
MRLFCSLPSPFARKVRALAAEKGIALELVVVDVLDPASPVAALNPLRKVPCLITDDGEAWYDSPVICEWLDALPGPRLLPAEFAARMAVKRVEALADGVMDAGVAIRLESIFAGRAEHERSAGWMDWQWLKVEGGVRELERQLGPCAWFVGDSLTLADLSVASALEWLDFRLPDRPWRPLAPRLSAWLESVASRPSLHNTRPAA